MTIALIKNMVDKQKQGKLNRQHGAEFERRVRADLESKGWIVDRWSNNVEMGYDKVGQITEDSKPHPIKLIKAKSNRFNMRSTGFPDFVAFMIEKNHKWAAHYSLPRMLGGFVEPHTKGEIPLEDFKLEGVIIAIEVKTNGYLDKIEREKCDWLLKNNIFSKIFIASKDKVKGRVVINYKEYGNNN